jgi:hypothetical protein
MAEDRRVEERRDRNSRVEAGETRRHLDLMSLAAPVPSQTPSAAVPEQGTSSEDLAPNNPPPPPDYDG